MILWGVNSFVVGYERMVRENRSIGFYAGYQEFPKYSQVAEDEFVELDYVERFGVRFAAEYRFYWSSRNTRPAPDGLYWGPYISYFYFDVKNNFWQDIGGDATKDLTFDAWISRYSLGLQLGYQFIINKKWSIDLIMLGPAITLNDGKMKITGEIGDDKKSELLEDMFDKLIDALPSLINERWYKDIGDEGDFINWGAGFRYLVQIGYYF
jgi:hypothetical protein